MDQQCIDEDQQCIDDNPNLHILYLKCSIKMQKDFHRQFTYDFIIMMSMIDLFMNEETYIHRCLICREDIGVPCQVCGRGGMCDGIPFNIDDDHFEYCETLEEVLDQFVRIVRLLSDFHIEDGLDNELKTLR